MSLSKLISLTNPKSPITEAYRTLRTNIQFSSLDQEIKAICVTSSVPGEGKSTTICNLAITMAQANKKVLLMDADLRKPTVHKQFDKSNDAGLTNALVQNTPIEEIVKQTSVEGLDILTSGPKPPNPSEILGSKAMKQFIEKVKEKYDRILIDCPPVGAVTDPAIISTIVDGTILVVSAGRTHIEEAKRSKQLLDNVNANIIGVVLNKIPVNSNGYYSKYYYYQYYYGDAES